MAGIPGSFPPSFWCYAVNLSAHVANLTPVHSLGYKSPYEMLALATGKTIAIAAVLLYKFGAAVIMHLEPQNRDTGPLAKNAVEVRSVSGDQPRQSVLLRLATGH